MRTLLRRVATGAPIAPLSSQIQSLAFSRRLVMAQQINGKPIRKVAAGAIAGATITVVLWTIKSMFKVDVPADVASAMTVLLTFVVSYQTPAADQDLVTVEAEVRQAA
jgi:hypothetical protein